MKYCTKCGAQLSDDAAFCTACGTSVNDSAPLNDIYGTGYAPAEKDEISVGFCVISALLPIFGIVFWLLKYKETPRKAKACGITAIISWVLSFILGTLLGVLWALFIYGVI